MTEHQVERLLTSLETIHDQLLATAIATNDSRAALGSQKMISRTTLAGSTIRQSDLRVKRENCKR